MQSYNTCQKLCFKKGKNHKAPIRFELMTERFVVNALNYCVKLVGNKIGKEKHYKILLELIVSIETTSQWRCPIPPLSVNSYHVSFANILNFFQLSSNQKQYISFCTNPGHLQREYIYTLLLKHRKFASMVTPLNLNNIIFVLHTCIYFFQFI